MSYYFYESSNISTNITSNENIKLNGNISKELNLSIISEHNILERNSNKRKLISESTCSEIRDNFIKYKDSQLSNVFDLNYGKIRKLCLANLIITCAIIVFSITLGLINKKKIHQLKL